MSTTAKELFRRLRSVLDEASNDRRLASTMFEIREAMKAPVRKGGDEVIAIGDPRNFHRSRELPHLVRDDGAWFDFAVTLREEQVVAWSFEIRFPEQEPRWLRFDLNPPDHTNDARGLRCHLRPGTDDDGLSVPLRQDWAPEAVLELLLDHLRRDGRIRGGEVGDPA